MVSGILVAEGDYSGTYSYETAEQLAAFMEGVSAGASQYGCGSCSVYTRADLKDLRADDRHDRRMIALIEKYLPPE